MANPNNKHSFTFEGNLAGGAVVMKSYVVLSQTKLSVGDPVVGAATPAGQSARVACKLAGTTSTALLGVCMSAVKSHTGLDSVLIIPALPEHLFSGQYGSTVNITSGFFTNNKKLSFSGTTSGKIVLAANNGNSVLQIIGLKPLSSFGTYAELLFVIAKSSFIGR